MWKEVDWRGEDHKACRGFQATGGHSLGSTASSFGHIRPRGINKGDLIIK